MTELKLIMKLDGYGDKKDLWIMRKKAKFLARLISKGLKTCNGVEYIG